MEKLKETLKYVEVISWALPVYIAGLFVIKVLNILYVAGGAVSASQSTAMVSITIIF